LGLDGYIRAGVAGLVRQHRGHCAMRYGSVCSGIEAATQAWHGLGWEPAFFSEIDAFPRAVLEHHHPDVPVHGDFTTIKEDEYGTIDVLVGGTPCQSFSIAGLRGGMDDERGNLALEFIRLAQRKRPQWVVWENVPGVLSSKGGRDFGSFLGALAEIGYGFAYRVLDAQFFGVAQRRRRVFVVGYPGDWRRAAAVLFERESLSGNPAPRGHNRKQAGEIVGTLTTRTGVSHDNYSAEEGHCLVTGGLPRWITPTECERLQGFPDGFTQIPYRNKPAEKCPDGPRYKALGNSMAVPVMRWIGERIQQVEAL
jgi:DNA (cytosine-5)-methyltransferase 1